MDFRRFHVNLTNCMSIRKWRADWPIDCHCVARHQSKRARQARTAEMVQRVVVSSVTTQILRPCAGLGQEPHIWPDYLGYRQPFLPEVVKSFEFAAIHSGTKLSLLTRTTAPNAWAFVSVG